jgi:hypothetical protein
MFENRVLRKIFGPKRDKIIGGWRKLHNEELLHFARHNQNKVKEDEMGRACRLYLHFGGKSRRKETTRKTKTWVGGEY